MKLRFNSYKRFATQQEIEIRPITLLLGKNNSGKSSVLKLLASFLRSLDGRTLYPGINLGNNGREDFSLGPSFESICHNGNMVDLSLGMDLDDGLSVDVSLFKASSGSMGFNSYTLRKEGRELRAVIDRPTGFMRLDNGLMIETPFKGLYNEGILHTYGMDCFPKTSIDYIGPLRTVPDRVWYLNPPSPDSGVGYYGRIAYDIMCSRNSLVERMNEWFVPNVEGCHVVVDKGPEEGSFIIKIKSYENDDFGVNIADAGMGINQVLPIVVSAVNERSPKLVAIEQPELHLHPAAHAAIARLLATSSKAMDRNFVVETHSANFLLGIREAVADSGHALRAEDVIIYFIEDDDEDGASIRPIYVGSDGTLSSWPTGVFGESYALMKSIKEKAYANSIVSS